MKISILQVSKKDDQRAKEDHQETYFTHILLFNSFHSSLYHFSHFFHSFPSVYKGTMFSTGSAVNLQDPLKTYKMIL